MSARSYFMTATPIMTIGISIHNRRTNYSMGLFDIHLTQKITHSEWETVVEILRTQFLEPIRASPFNFPFFSTMDAIQNRFAEGATLEVDSNLVEYGIPYAMTFLLDGDPDLSFHAYLPDERTWIHVDLDAEGSMNRLQILFEQACVM